MKKSALLCLFLMIIGALTFQAIEQSKSQVEKEIEAELSVDESYKHMTFFVEEVGEKLAGTESIKKAAEYVRKELEKYGLDSRIDRFPMYHSYPHEQITFIIEGEIEFKLIFSVTNFEYSQYIYNKAQV